MHANAHATRQHMSVRYGQRSFPSRERTHLLQAGRSLSSMRQHDKPVSHASAQQDRRHCGRVQTSTNGQPVICQNSDTTTPIRPAHDKTAAEPDSSAKDKQARLHTTSHAKERKPMPYRKQRFVAMRQQDPQRINAGRRELLCVCAKEEEGEQQQQQRKTQKAAKRKTSRAICVCVQIERWQHSVLR